MIYYRVTCGVCGYYVTVNDDDLNMFIMSAPQCPKCQAGIWAVGEAREYTSMFDQEAEDEAPMEFHPIPFTEDAIKKEFASCMGELHLWLVSPEGKAAELAAQYDPKGPWS